MKEMLEVFSLEGEKTGEIEKKEAHQKMREEYLKKKKVSSRHQHVRLILMTSNGRVILQRRSKWKGDNPGLWDKTIGGHVSSGDSFDLTVLKECSEELGIPSTILKEEEFEHYIPLTNLNILAIIRRLAYLDNYQSIRKMADEQDWVEPSITQFYIGYYDGPIRFVDSESCGIQVFSKEELIREIKEHPQAFSEDVKYIMKKFANDIKPAPKHKDKVLND